MGGRLSIHFENVGLMSITLIILCLFALFCWIITGSVVAIATHMFAPKGGKVWTAFKCSIIALLYPLWIFYLLSRGKI